jgi:hypothetical protein
MVVASADLWCAMMHNVQPPDCSFDSHHHHQSLSWRLMLWSQAIKMAGEARRGLKAQTRRECLPSCYSGMCINRTSTPSTATAPWVSCMRSRARALLGRNWIMARRAGPLHSPACSPSAPPRQLTHRIILFYSEPVSQPCLNLACCQEVGYYYSMQVKKKKRGFYPMYE